MLVPALALAGCGALVGKPEASVPLAGATYVAMGSSIASGPGLGPPKPGTPARCTRSYINYPTLLAEEMRMALFDVSCSGATTGHILGPWGELPAQIDAVTPDTRLVTVTIGGNDLNYVGALIAAGCEPDGLATIAGRTFQCPPSRAPTEEDYSRLEANMREIARQVAQKAPNAILAFVQYPRLVPDTLCSDTPISEEAAAQAREIAQRLADINARVASETGSLLIPMHDLSQGHTDCGAEPWSVGNPPAYDGTDGAPWHLNAAGMRAVAETIAARLNR